MFTKRTTLIATALAFAAAAVAAPAQAASSGGAVVDRTSGCQENQQVCQTVQTPSGIRSSSTFSNWVDTDPSDGTTTRTRMSSHSLDRDGVSIEVGLHYAKTNGGCTDREDSQQVRNGRGYNHEVYHCP